MIEIYNLKKFMLSSGENNHSCLFCPNNYEKTSKYGGESDYLNWAIARFLFTSALPLLFHAGTFVCYVSILDQYVPPINAQLSQQLNTFLCKKRYCIFFFNLYYFWAGYIVTLGQMPPFPHLSRRISPTPHFQFNVFQGWSHFSETSTKMFFFPCPAWEG